MALDILEKPFTTAKKQGTSLALNKVVLNDFISGYSPGTTPDKNGWILAGAVSVPALSSVVIDDTQDWRDRMIYFGLTMELATTTYLPGGVNDANFDGSSNLKDASGELCRLTLWYTGNGGIGYCSKFLTADNMTRLFVDNADYKLYVQNLHGVNTYDFYFYFIFSGNHDERT
jgi:hypothetical protein